MCANNTNQMRTMERLFDKGDFIKNKDPYEGEGEYLVVDFNYNEKEWNGYKCARMKGKFVPAHDFHNHLIIYKGEQSSYERVG